MVTLPVKSLIPILLGAYFSNCIDQYSFTSTLDTGPRSRYMFEDDTNKTGQLIKSELTENKPPGIVNSSCPEEDVSNECTRREFEDSREALPEVTEDFLDMFQGNENFSLNPKTFASFDGTGHYSSRPAFLLS